MITNDARCISDIKSGVNMGKAAFKNKNKRLFISNLVLRLRKKLVNCYIWSRDMYVWCWNWDTSGSRSEIPGKF